MFKKRQFSYIFKKQKQTMSRFMEITLLMLLCSLFCTINAFIVEDDKLLIDKGIHTYFYNYNLLYKEFSVYKTCFSNAEIIWPKWPLK